MENNIISVNLWSREVGRLYWSDANRCAVFSYNRAFIEEGPDIAPLTHSIKNATDRPFFGNKEKLYDGLPEFVADSLPDRWGSLLFERWAEENDLLRSKITPIDKLSFIGKRGMGALEFVPAVDMKEEVKEGLNLESLYGLAKKIFEERERVHISPDESLTMQSLYDVGTSAGGQHPKAIIAINKETKEIRSGQIMQGEGYEYYILKFADGHGYPNAEIEQTYYDMALKAGINMMPSRLICIEGRNHFITKRFDRVDNTKIFTQTLAALNPGAESYADLFYTARRLSIPMNEQIELFRRMVFNVMTANIDDHSKNFSFMLSEKDGWHITPAYDLTFTTDLDGMRLGNRHEMSVLGKTYDITAGDMQKFADLNNIKNSMSIIEKVSESVSKFREFAHKNRVAEYWIDRIEEHISHLVLPSSTALMTGYMPTVVEDYHIKGKEIKNVSLKENSKHEYALSAEIDGKLCRKIFKTNSEGAKEIMDKGGVKMPAESIKELIEILI